MGLTSNNEKHKQQQTSRCRIIIRRSVLHAADNCSDCQLPSFDDSRPAAVKR